MNILESNVDRPALVFRLSIKRDIIFDDEKQKLHEKTQLDIKI